MGSKKPRLATYTEQIIVDKFTIISKEESRTMSKQLEYIIKEYIKKYELKNGTIEIGEQTNERKL